MPATLNSLSPEIIDLIVSELCKAVSTKEWPLYATISRPFQVAIERKTFARLRLTNSDEPELQAIGAHPWRRTAVRSIIYTVALPSYPENRRYCRERRREHQDNLLVFHRGLTKFWKELGTWKDKAPVLKVEMHVQSPMDQYYDGWHEGRSNEYRWLYPDHILSIDSNKVTLPTVACVNSFTLCDGRQIHPATLREIFLTLPNLRTLDLTIPSPLAQHRATRAEYRAGLAKALEAPTLHGLESFDLCMDDDAPKNHDFNIALSKDAFYPNGDVLSHAIRKLSQRSLRFLKIEGPCVVSPALWISPQDGDSGFPYMEELEVEMPIVTYDGRWYYTRDDSASDSDSVDSIEMELEFESGSESESTNPSRYDEEINVYRAAFFNGVIPYNNWRRAPDPDMYDPFVRSLAAAALHMPQLQYLRVTTKGHRNSYKGYYDVGIDFVSPKFPVSVSRYPSEINEDNAKCRWIIDIGCAVSWDVPDDVVETMKQRVGDDGLVLVYSDGEVLDEI